MHPQNKPISNPPRNVRKPLGRDQNWDFASADNEIALRRRRNKANGGERRIPSPSNRRFDMVSRARAARAF
jgi:hypothetical protein